MNNIDLTTALARLLSSESLRRVFAGSPHEAARRIDLRNADLEAFLAIDRFDLDLQASGLISKRRHEVSRLLARTVTQLGDEFGRLFWNYATHYWPTGHQRHLTDAVEFCRYLDAHDIRAVDRSEFNRLDFAVSKERFSIRLVRERDSRHRRWIQLLFRNHVGTSQIYSRIMRVW